VLCLAEGRHLYLEASSEASRKLYLRNGFKDLCEYVLGDAGPTLYIMARPPARNAQLKETRSQAQAGSAVRTAVEQ
jgi:hypothetical protein